jgi:hypothetical protein
MGRKKRDYGFLKPFCYYCDKIMNNEIILHMHQKVTDLFIFRLNILLAINVEKNFQLLILYKHMLPLSIKKLLQSIIINSFFHRVNNALNGRDSIELNIFGM